MAQTYFFVMAVGVPLGLLIIAIAGAHFYGGGSEELLDWKPTRSPKREAELQLDEVRQMLAAQNRYRRQRGAPERSLEEATGHAWADLEPDGNAWR